MARGWESKSVEQQQDQGLTAHEQRQTASREELERSHKRESLEMQRRRVAHDLETSRSAVHRTALENALRYLDEEIGKLR